MLAPCSSIPEFFGARRADQPSGPGNERALFKALADFEGTMLFVSHDRQFLGRSLQSRAGDHRCRERRAPHAGLGDHRDCRDRAFASLACALLHAVTRCSMRQLRVTALLVACMSLLGGCDDSDDDAAGGSGGAGGASSGCLPMESMGGGDPGTTCCDVDEDCPSFSCSLTPSECVCQSDGPQKGECVPLE